MADLAYNSNTHQLYIREVLIYLRKSRGDEETDLEKHRMILVDLCIKNGWKYVEYTEIGTSDSIDMRPKMKQLLKDVEEGIYDAVCVVDYDRLSRGDMGEQDRVKKAFQRSNTLIVTPQKIYNLNDELDDTYTDFQGLLARQEYKMILKRLSRGKKMGSRRGDWTNGIPPFPYEYQSWNGKHNEKGLVINDDKLPIYRFIIDSYLRDHKTTSEIAWELNKQQIPSPRNSLWSNVTISRMLADETHLGKIISNKTIGDGHAKKKATAKEHKRLPKDEWIIVENCHEAVKSVEEHEQILDTIRQRNLYPNRTTKNPYALTGLIKCGICGHTMIVHERKDRKGTEYLKPCWYKNPYGIKCENGGQTIEFLHDEILKQLQPYKNFIIEEMKRNKNTQDEFLTSKINDTILEIKINEDALENIYRLYDRGKYSDEIFETRKNKTENVIRELEDQLKIYQTKLENALSKTNPEKLIIIENFEEKIKHRKSLSNEFINSLYKTVIDSIVWLKPKDSDDFEATINFL